MNFYNEDEKKDGAAAPAAFKKTSSFGKAPLFSRTAGGLMDRLKNLSRKDMAFVGIGLSVLVMAPVAEYMMSKPSSDNLLTPGFGSREGGAPTGLYEPGINALSQGSPDGSGEVITPLSSRDPASLILGSQPAAPAMPPPAPPTTFRDSMKDVGRAAFSEASKAAPSPTPIPRMQAALRGMSSFFGGGDSTRTSGSLGGGKIIDDAKSASNKAAKRSMVGPVAMPGYKGVASNTPNSSSKGAFEKLRSAADKSAGNFTGGSAISSLDKAAADAPTVGAGGGGMGYGGDSEKTGKTSPYNNKYEHSRSGESLAEMAAKQRMQKALDWEFFKQYEIPKMFINAIITGITGPLTKFVDGTMTHILGMDPPPAAKCWVPMGKQTGTLASDWEAARKSCAGSPDPKCVLERVCTIDGGPTQVSYQAGKESASSYEKNCMCNEYAGKTGSNPNPGPGGGQTGGGQTGGGQTGGGQTGGGQTGGGQTGGGQTSPVPALKDYDAALKSIVELTLQAAAEAPKAEANLAAVVDNFQTLGTQVNGPIQRFLTTESQGKASAVVAAYKGEVGKADSAMAVIKPEYKKFLAAVEAIKADIKKGTLRQEPVKSDGAAKSALDPTAAKLPPEAIAAVEKAIKDWEGSTKISFELADGLLAEHKLWIPWYEAQINDIGSGVSSILARQAEVTTAVGKINGSGGIPEKFKALTGKDVQGQPAKTEGMPSEAKDTGAASQDNSAAAGEHQLAVEAKMRGIALDPLWKVELNEGDAKKNESAAWEELKKSAPVIVTAKVPGNMVSNPLRSKSVIDSVTSERTPSVLTMQSHLNAVRPGIEKTKKDILAQKVDSSYFTGVTTGGGQQTPGGKVSAPMAMLRDDLIRNVGITTDKYPASQAKLETMPQALAGTPYAQASATAQGDARNLAAAKTELDKKIAELRTAPNNAAVEKKAQEVRAAETAYKAAEAKFANSYQAAMQTPAGMNTNGAGIQAKKAQAIKYRSEIAAAYSRCTGTSFPQEVCRVGIADRIAQIEERAEQKEAVALSSNNEAELGRVVTFLSGERNTACGLISQAKTRCYAYPKASRQVCLDNFTKGVCGN
jgi:hypothetical protein